MIPWPRAEARSPVRSAAVLHAPADHECGLQDDAEGSQCSPSWRWTSSAAGTGQPMATDEELHRGARCRRRSRIVSALARMLLGYFGICAGGFTHQRLPARLDGSTRGAGHPTQCGRRPLEPGPLRGAPRKRKTGQTTRLADAASGAGASQATDAAQRSTRIPAPGSAESMTSFCG